MEGSCSLPHSARAVGGEQRKWRAQNKPCLSELPAALEVEEINWVGTARCEQCRTCPHEGWCQKEGERGGMKHHFGYGGWP